MTTYLCFILIILILMTSPCCDPKDILGNFYGCGLWKLKRGAKEESSEQNKTNQATNKYIHVHNLIKNPLEPAPLEPGKAFLLFTEGQAVLSPWWMC
jgi:hypothetical protein